MALGDELRGDAVDVLDHALAWRLAPDGWAAVDTAVGSTLTAFECGDTEALQSAIAALDLLDPRRGKKAGTPPEVPPPDPVRERINDTIHKLGR